MSAVYILIDMIALAFKFTRVLDVYLHSRFYVLPRLFVFGRVDVFCRDSDSLSVSREREGFSMVGLPMDHGLRFLLCQCLDSPPFSKSTS